MLEQNSRRITYKRNSDFKSEDYTERNTRVTNDLRNLKGNYRETGGKKEEKSNNKKRRKSFQEQMTNKKRDKDST